MSNPAAFIQACNEGRLWVHCDQCNDPKPLNRVERLDTIQNQSYWGPEPWWHDTHEFTCPDCGTVQKSLAQLQE
ncbi:hypothetical protein DESUT3_38210 [Desulfuromonas versatilis]|uniref:Uncharacterized protein n=1 Tax=Desulfuromonas versatilis TaxID=2802975 RepID=A0ABM8HV00_9BACT|nr:hypothetical protein [Desulfuromonas versatilis]BCR06752.1 hypothetical protein DESUT3_38210 [Desulfuromonas versatilis]